MFPKRLFDHYLHSIGEQLEYPPASPYPGCSTHISIPHTSVEENTNWLSNNNCETIMLVKSCRQLILECLLMLLMISVLNSKYRISSWYLDSNQLPKFRVMYSLLHYSENCNSKLKTLMCRRKIKKIKYLSIKHGT